MNADAMQAWITMTNAGLLSPLCTILLIQQIALSFPCLAWTGCIWTMQWRVRATRSCYPKVKQHFLKREPPEKGEAVQTPPAEPHHVSQTLRSAAGWTLTSCPRTPGWSHWGPFSCLCCSSNPQIPWASSCSLSAWWHQWHQHSFLVLQINSMKKRDWRAAWLAPFVCLGVS